MISITSCEKSFTYCQKCNDKTIHTLKIGKTKIKNLPIKVKVCNICNYESYLTW